MAEAQPAVFEARREGEAERIVLHGHAELRDFAGREEEVFAELPLRRVIGFCGHTQERLMAWGMTFCDEVWPKSRVEAGVARLLLEPAVEGPEDEEGHQGPDGDEGEEERRDKRRDDDAAGRS